MLKRNQPESQQEPNPCTIYTYNPPLGFEMFSSLPSVMDYLNRQEFRELSGSYGIVRFYALPENSRLAHKFAVLMLHEKDDILFLLREHQIAEFLQKCVPVAPIIQTYLPWFEGQVMAKKLPG